VVFFGPLYPQPGGAAPPWGPRPAKIFFPNTLKKGEVLGGGGGEETLLNIKLVFWFHL